MITIGVIASLLAAFWSGVLVERSRWVIDSIDDFSNE